MIQSAKDQSKCLIPEDAKIKVELDASASSDYSLNSDLNAPVMAIDHDLQTHW